MFTTAEITGMLILTVIVIAAAIAIRRLLDKSIAADSLADGKQAAEDVVAGAAPRTSDASADSKVRLAASHRTRRQGKGSA